jgi:murein DD-endopeptidase MepM/ murein hydrolase activator NlpD
MKKEKNSSIVARLLSLVLALAMCFTTLTSASAATTSKLPSLSTSKYIRCYTLVSSGKVYAYTSSSLTTKKSGYWIDCSTDECYIVAVSGNAVKVSYPIGNGKRSTQWFRRSDFTATNISGSLTTKTITANITSYIRPGGKSYGYAGKGDSIFVLGTSGSYTQIIYELSSGLWKMGWVKTATLNQYTKTTTTTTNTSKTTTTNKTTTTATTDSSGDTTEWQMPMKNAYATWGGGGETYSWGKNCTSYSRSNENGRNYHNAIDINSDDDETVYATASGTVYIVNTEVKGVNGCYIVIKHQLNGKTVYSFYAHLKKDSILVSKGDKVTAGQAIAEVGNTSTLSKVVVHLHFAITDSCTSGDFYGYTYSFDGNLTTFRGVTYYNPIYVINNKKLPS